MSDNNKWNITIISSKQLSNKIKIKNIIRRLLKFCTRFIWGAKQEILPNLAYKVLEYPIEIRLKKLIVK